MSHLTIVSYIVAVNLLDKTRVHFVPSVSLYILKVTGNLYHVMLYIVHLVMSQTHKPKHLIDIDCTGRCNFKLSHDHDPVGFYTSCLNIIDVFRGLLDFRCLCSNFLYVYLFV